jgi:hypothetical protein
VMTIALPLMLSTRGLYRFDVPPNEMPGFPGGYAAVGVLPASSPCASLVGGLTPYDGVRP